MGHTLSARLSRTLVPAMLFALTLWATVSALSAQTARDVAGEQTAIIERFEPPLTAQPKVKLSVTNEGADAPAKETERVRSKDENSR